MFMCPRCHKGLSQQKIPSLGLIWTCPICHGRAMTLGLLRKTLPKSLVDHLWQQGRAEHPRIGRPCLACERPMAEVPITPGPNKTVCLDVCILCHFVWFDPHEFESLPTLRQKASDLEGLSDEAKKALAMAQLELLKKDRFTPESGVLDVTDRCYIAVNILELVIQLLTGW